MSKESNISFSLSSHVDVEENGIKIISYIDVGKTQSDEPIEISYSYSQWKNDLISSYIIPEKGLGFDKSIEEGRYRAPKDDLATEEVLKEIRALKKFAEDLEKEFSNNIK